MPKNLRHFSFLGGWVRATGGKKLLIGQQKEKADKTHRYGGEGMCVHDLFTDPKQTMLRFNERVSENTNKGESE